MIIDVVEVETFEAGLGEFLAFLQIELGSELSPAGLSNEIVFEVVALEDVIKVVGLHLIGTNGKVLEGDVGPGTGGDGFRTDGKGDYHKRKE